MDVKECAQAAKRYIAEVFADESISEIRLEEVVIDDPSGVWRITVSFLRPVAAPGRSPTEALALGLGGALASRPLERDYKIVEIDDAGKLRAVKHRVLDAVD